jgi:hypothetical protein
LDTYEAVGAKDARGGNYNTHRESGACARPAAQELLFLRIELKTHWPLPTRLSRHIGNRIAK